MTFAGMDDRIAIENEMPWEARDLPKTLYHLLARTAKNILITRR